MKNINKKHRILQSRILSICGGDGDVWQKYEACKRLLKWAESQKIIAGSDYMEWIDFAIIALGLESGQGKGCK